MPRGSSAPGCGVFGVAQVSLKPTTHILFLGKFIDNVRKENLVSSHSISTDVCPVGSIGYRDASASATFEQGVGIYSMACASTKGHGAILGGCVLLSAVGPG